LPALGQARGPIGSHERRCGASPGAFGAACCDGTVLAGKSPPAPARPAGCQPSRLAPYLPYGRASPGPGRRLCPRRPAAAGPPAAAGSNWREAPIMPAQPAALRSAQRFVSHDGKAPFPGGGQPPLTAVGRLRAGVTVGFHRLLTHRSFTGSRPLRVALAVAGSMSFQGEVIGWVAIHRRHHAFTDRPAPPCRHRDGERARPRATGP
jgi:hypothetical protein